MSLLLIVISPETAFDFGKPTVSEAEDENVSIPVRGKLKAKAIRQVDGPARWIACSSALYLIADY